MPKEIKKFKYCSACEVYKCIRGKYPDYNCFNGCKERKLRFKNPLYAFWKDIEIGKIKTITYNTAGIFFN